MKKLMLLTVLVAVTCIGAEQKKKDAYDIRPEAATAAAAPTAVEWEKKNDKQLAAATTPEVLSSLIRSEIACVQLLREVKTGFQTDAMKATQIAAISQYVMRKESAGASWSFWHRSAKEERADWTRALLDVALSAKESDVKIFMLDQLRWCGCPSMADEIDTKTEGGCAHVKEMGDLVAAELRAAAKRAE